VHDGRNKRKENSMKFPKQIMMRIDREGKEEYLISHRHLSELTELNGEKIAVYELKFTKKVEVKVRVK